MAIYLFFNPQRGELWVIFPNKSTVGYTLPFGGEGGVVGQCSPSGEKFTPK
jgi:hypothetical protein